MKRVESLWLAVPLALLVTAIFITGFAVTKMQEQAAMQEQTFPTLDKARSFKEEAYTPLYLSRGQVADAQLKALESGMYEGPCTAVCQDGKKAEVLLFSPLPNP